MFPSRQIMALVGTAHNNRKHLFKPQLNDRDTNIENHHHRRRGMSQCDTLFVYIVCVCVSGRRICQNILRCRILSGSIKFWGPFSCVRLKTRSRSIASYYYKTAVHVLGTHKHSTFCPCRCMQATRQMLVHLHLIVARCVCVYACMRNLCIVCLFGSSSLGGRFGGLLLLLLLFVVGCVALDVWCIHCGGLVLHQDEHLTHAIEL